MLKKLTSIFAFIIVLSNVSLAQQTGKISGTVIDATTKEGVPFAAIVVYQNGIQKKGATTDFDGNYSISPLTPGTYSIAVQFAGYVTKQINSISVGPGKNTKIDVELKENISDIEFVEVVVHKTPLIGREGKIEGMGGDEIVATGSRSVANIVNLVGGTSNEDDGGAVSIKGDRSSGTVTFIDGVKIIGSSNLPPSAIDRLDVLTGGIPAQYGDVSGGVINITTKGVSNKTYGGFEFETGRPFNPWNTEYAGANLSGPLLSEVAVDEDGNVIKDGDGNPMKDTKMGYFVAAQYNGAKDSRPSAIPIYQLTDEARDDIFQNPLVRSGPGYQYKINQVTDNPNVNVDDVFQTVRVRPNTQTRNLAVNGKLDFKLSENATFTVGGNYNYSRDNLHIERYRLLNYNNNPMQTTNSYNVYARLRSSLGTDAPADSNASIISNAYYQVQIDYSKFKTIVEDPIHRDNLFNYGHVGALKTNFISDYQNITTKDRAYFGDDYMAVPVGRDSASSIGSKYYYNIENGVANMYSVSDTTNTVLTSVDPSVVNQGLYVQAGQSANGVEFTPSPYNELSSNYVAHYFSLQNEINQDVRNLDQIISQGLYINGGRSQLVGNGIWFATGRAYNGYSINDVTQIRMTALASAEINKKHSITFGFEYEQRDSRDYSINPLELWGLAAANVNNQFQSNDGNINYDYSSGPTETIFENGLNFYNYKFDINSNNQRAFDKNLREKMGYSDQEWIDVHNISPENLEVGMFNAAELWDFRAVNYRGYDMTGKRVSNAGVEFEDFFRDSVARPQASFNPIYSAFFIEDKFDIEDLVIRLGVRVDRYDANQKVLKDKYATVDLSTVGQTNLSQFGNGSELTSGVIQDDWNIYVDRSSEDFAGTDAEQKKYNVVGFRDGNTWYDKSGNEVRNPTFFSGGSSLVNPWFDYASSLEGLDRDLFVNNRITLDAFEDYKPQINVMPRVAFSFPISESAGFYAHYDVLTQRPTNNSIRPSDFYFLNIGGGFLNNPNLKPVRKINYQLGFQQKLSEYSALTLEAYYNEFRDQINITRVNYAYPQSYITFDNIDFGTSKGLTVGYDLRRKKNFRMNFNYTLAFADGTGSAVESANGLIAAGFDNVKTPFALNFDQRHALKLNMDYRLKAIMGEKKEDKDAKEKWYSRAGLNFTLVAGSGRPYSRNSTKLTEILIGQAGQTQLSGQPNGSRLPWNIRGTVRLDKDIKVIKADKEKGKEDKFVNLYLYVENVFNNKNVLQVYRNTGSVDDDGYLAIAPDLSQTTRDLYVMALQNPEFISLPRRARIGISYSF